MNAARTGGSEANTQPAGKLRIAAGHEGSGFLVPHLNEADLVLAMPQEHSTVQSVAGYPLVVGKGPYLVGILTMSDGVGHRVLARRLPPLFVIATPCSRHVARMLRPL